MGFIKWLIEKVVMAFLIVVFAILLLRFGPDIMKFVSNLPSFANDLQTNAQKQVRQKVEVMSCQVVQGNIQNCTANETVKAQKIGGMVNLVWNPGDNKNYFIETDGPGCSFMREGVKSVGPVGVQVGPAKLMEWQSFGTSTNPASENKIGLTCTGNGKVLIMTFQ